MRFSVPSRLHQQEPGLETHSVQGRGPSGGQVGGEGAPQLLCPWVRWAWEAAGGSGEPREGGGMEWEGLSPGPRTNGHSPEPELPPGGKGSVPTACYTNTMPTTQRPGPSQCGPRGKPPTYILDSVQVDSEGTLRVRPNSGGPGREARPSLPPPSPRQRKQQTRRLWAPHSQPLRPAAGRGMFRAP